MSDGIMSGSYWSIPISLLMTKYHFAGEQVQPGDIMRSSAVYLSIILLIYFSAGSILLCDACGEPDPKGSVSSIGSTIIVALDGSGNFTTIQDAVDSASKGDVILVYDGVYKEAVNIGTSITLIGNGTSRTFLDGDGTLDHQHLFQISSNYVNVTGFQFMEGSPHHEFAGIGIYSSGCVIDGNEFYDNTNGIYVAGGPDNMISNNTFDTNYYGIRSDSGANGNFIMDNTFNSSVTGGIIYMGARDVAFGRNDFNDNRYHLSLFNSHGCDVGWNSFFNADPGRAGFTTGTATENMIHNNTFLDNDIGLGLVKGSDRNLIFDNTFDNNLEGIRTYDSSSNVRVHRNSFINNSDWGMNCSSTSSPINGTDNWWGNYTGPYHPVSNSDGTGDNVSDNVTFIPWMMGEFVNRNPALHQTGDVYATEDLLFNIRLNASDPDGHEVIFKVVTDASWLDFNTTSWNLSGVPCNGDVGSFNIDINITDGWGGYAEDNFTLTVNNTPPVILTNVLPIGTEDEEYEVVIDFIEEEGGVWNFSSNATWLEFDDYNVSISGTPENGDDGSYWVNLSISDGNGGSDEVNLSFSVEAVDDLPELVTALKNLDMVEDTEYLLDLSNWVVDVDDDLLNYSYKGTGNLVVEFDPLGHDALITPASNWSGFEMANFTVHLQKGMISQTIMVDVRPVNDAPSNIDMVVPAYPVSEGEIFPLIGSADDPDIPYGDFLDFNWSSNISGHIGSGPMIYINLTAGVHEITLNVSDTQDEGISIIRTLEILPVVDDDNTTIPDNDTIPDDNTTIPDDNTTIPDDNSTVPDDNTTVPDDDNNTVPDDDTTVPDDDDTIDEGGDGDNDTILYLLLILVILIFFIVVAVFFYTNRGGKDDDLSDWSDEE